MGRLSVKRLDVPRLYSCKQCKSHLAAFDDLISKSFHCYHGKAYLFGTVVNIGALPSEDRLMTTGLHTVSDIYCTACNQIIGWKYEQAYEKSQKYKEGKFILERHKIVERVSRDSHAAGEDDRGFVSGSHSQESEEEDLDNSDEFATME
eukprot:PRCOL_00003654-RA